MSDDEGSPSNAPMIVGAVAGLAILGLLTVCGGIAAVFLFGFWAVPGPPPPQAPPIVATAEVRDEPDDALRPDGGPGRGGLAGESDVEVAPPPHAAGAEVAPAPRAASPR